MKKKTFSLREIGVAIFIAFVFVLVCILLYARSSLVSNFKEQQLLTYAESLISITKSQINDLIPGIIVEERASGNSLILESLRQAEKLESAKIVLSLSNQMKNWSKCIERTDLTEVCIESFSGRLMIAVPIFFGGKNIGFFVKEAKSIESLDKGLLTRPLFNVFLFLCLALVALIIGFLYLLETSIRRPLSNLQSVFWNADQGLIPKLLQATGRISDINVLIEKVYSMSKNFESMKMQSETGKLVSQVAHDIRSPLSALEMMTPSLNELPEEKRIIIRNAINRIRDIANSLLDKNREVQKQDNSSENGTPQIANANANAELSQESKTVNLLYPLIDSIISEKRLQYREFLKVRIEFNQTQSNYGLFALIQSSEFKRILSNMINNSVEALIDQQGVVEISINSDNQNKIQILIHDNGKGIDSELISKLGERGATFGKESGSGLGLYHAKECLKQWGGELDIQSIAALAKNHGTAVSNTTVTLILPKQPAPDWFVPALSLKAINKVVVFDDDQTIHQIWQGRFESSGATKAGIELVHISAPHDFRKFYGANFADLDSILFLVDYEIIGHKETGLDLVEELGIQSQSILVTSRYEEPAIRDRCSRLQIKLIPKPMSGFVPIEVG